VDGQSDAWTLQPTTLRSLFAHHANRSHRNVQAIEAMPADKRRGTTKKRTHNLGGCATCRRRHVKCDRSRPTCGTCRRAGHECSGYPSGVRWMSMSYGPSESSRSSSGNKQSLRPFQGSIKSPVRDLFGLSKVQNLPNVMGLNSVLAGINSLLCLRLYRRGAVQASFIKTNL
jgi:hypothetical protein